MNTRMDELIDISFDEDDDLNRRFNYVVRTPLDCEFVTVYSQLIGEITGQRYKIGIRLEFREVSDGDYQWSGPILEIPPCAVSEDQVKGFTRLIGSGWEVLEKLTTRFNGTVTDEDIEAIKPIRVV